MAQYYWCFRHGTVEEGPGCRAADRLGPYDSPGDAAAWLERRDRRDEEWEAEERRWHGDRDHS